MPSAWNRKRERQYEHIKKSAKERGKSEDRAEEIAARTVNKQRRKSGETPKKTTEGTGNPNKPLKERTTDELYNMAQDIKVPRRSKMTKDELLKAIKSRR